MYQIDEGTAALPSQASPSAMTYPNDSGVGVGMPTGTYVSCGDTVRSNIEGFGYQQQLVR
jgi:hypothetical protein